MGHKDLPFEVGQVAESRSFIQGFRGAWFRCKIKKISWKKGQMGHDLEYVDFPDEKIEWTKLYQKPINTKEVKSQLMVRPCFPPIYRESEMPDVNTISKVVVIFDDVLKVGDLVDWFTDGCYWSGRIIELLGDEKVKIELPPPPMGEGLSYEAIRNELRPSLDWTPEYGWMVPKLEKGNDRCCARIVKPFTQDFFARYILMPRDQLDLPTNHGIITSCSSTIVSLAHQLDGMQISTILCCRMMDNTLFTK
ncbi:uncharacterized protein LOC126688716 isoform X4 [Quercus robur]|uniref:uncharacterized protein LOC126688716 isoform X4 n=1 Tax=Quercus robur TaxID=38942 RepID=UPI002162DB8E|nr:uncharacterized protein LOC126688716 isoform X4 [Quercus robur]